MKIIVTVKQVPDTNEIKIDPDTGTLIRDGVPAIINPEDRHALEAALQIRERLDDVSITAVSMGPPQAASALTEALAMGADHACLVSDRAFSGADTLATAYTLAMAVKALGKFDLILCGSQAIDGDTAQVGPQLAECLGIAQITYARNIEVEDRAVSVTSRMGRFERVVRADLPALVTVVPSVNTPRYKTMNGIVRAFRDKSVQVLNCDDLGANPLRIGLAGSPTGVRQTFVPELGRRGQIKEGGPEALAAGILETLADEHLLPSE